MPEIVIVDTSVLIALGKIELIGVLYKIYEEIILPGGVVKEFGNVNMGCYSTQKVESRLVDFLMQDLNLGIGESEVIALAYETDRKALIDDLKARYDDYINGIKGLKPEEQLSLIEVLSTQLKGISPKKKNGTV